VATREQQREHDRSADGGQRDVTREAVVESNVPDVALVTDASVKGVALQIRGSTVAPLGKT
jgi:hypothetical protein